VSLLYGKTPRSLGYVRGALGLGQALQRTSAQHDKVMMYTDDVPQPILDCIRKSGFWKLRNVSYLRGCDTLGDMRRWSGVFTKFRLFGLTEYKKVLFLDLDMLILENIDELFDLDPPAAMMKGRRNPEHGEPINGRLFFPGDYWNEPHGGINAGLMLLEPNEQIHAQIELEVRDESHPEHIYCCGPEQEYLSRFYADRWTHISGKYNFQMYRLDTTRAIQKLTDRLEPGLVDSISAAQFSSHPKPWDLVGLSESELKSKVRDVHSLSYDFEMSTGPDAGDYKIGEPEELLELSYVLIKKWMDIFAEAVIKSPEPDLAGTSDGKGHTTAPTYRPVDQRAISMSSDPNSISAPD
jgi:lipopolysaccharide biosynthesis glycosyltransferase